MNGEVAIATPVGQLFYGKPLTRDGNHVYRWGGEKVPGVTSICRVLDKPALVPWAANMAVDHIKAEYWDHPLDRPVELGELFNVCEVARKAHVRKKDEGAKTGTDVHAYTQACFSQNALLPITSDKPDVVAACTAFRDWWGRHEVHCIAVERHCFSERHQYAGQMDFYGRIDGELGILDNKTGKGVYPEVVMQLTGYELALVEELRINEPLTRWALHLSKQTGQFKLYKWNMNRDHLRAWVALVVFYRYWRTIEKDLDKMLKGIA